MSDPHYKSYKDPDFIAAAMMAGACLEEAVVWLNGLIKKCQGGGPSIPMSVEDYRALIYQILDPEYEKKQAESYIGILKHNVAALEHPETSTPQGRHDARTMITMCYSWMLEWKKGDAQRYHLYGDHVAPTEWMYGAYPFTKPSLIAEVVVGQNDLTPGIGDRFADNQ